MLAKDLLSDFVFPLKKTDTGVLALNLMDVFKISHLPIVDNGMFVGMISEADIIDFNKPDSTIENHTLSLARPFVREEQHIYEVIEVLSRLQLTVVPVLDGKDNFAGLITLNELIKHLSVLFGLKQPGGIIVIEMNPKNYSLKELSHLIEGNNVKILSLYIQAHTTENTIDVVLKLNKTDISAVIQTLERYNYVVKSYHAEEDSLKDIYDERYELLMKYLDI